MTRTTLLLALIAGLLLCGTTWAQPAEPVPAEEEIPFLDAPGNTSPGAAMGGPEGEFSPEGFGNLTGGHQGEGGPEETLEGMEDFDAYRTDLAKQSAQSYAHKEHLFASETIVYLLALLIVATLALHTRRRGWWMATILGFSLVVMGLLRSGCICPVGSVSNIAGTLLGDDKWLIHKGVVMLFVLPLVFALLFGRVFCGGVCPMGAIQQFLSNKRSLRAHPLDRVLRYGRWVMFVVVLVAAVWFSACALCRIDPFLPIFQFGGVAMHNAINAASGKPVAPMAGYADAAIWAFPVTFLLLCMIIARPFCRWLCPYSVLLGLLSKISFRHRHIEASACINCKLCTKICPTAAIETQAAEVEDEKETQCIDQFNCISCGKCSDVCPTDAVK